MKALTHLQRLKGESIDICARPSPRDTGALDGADLVAPGSFAREFK
jgi:hypothetical protein